MMMEELILQKLDTINERLNVIDERFDVIDERFDGMDERFDGMDKRFDEMQEDTKLEFFAVRKELDVVYKIALKTENWMEHKIAEEKSMNNDLQNVRQIPTLMIRLEAAECVLLEHNERIGQLEN